MKRVATYPLTIEAFDRLPRLAREAMANSTIIGCGDSRLRIARAPAAIMAERIMAADRLFCCGDNLQKHAKVSSRQINAVLQGLDR